MLTICSINNCTDESDKLVIYNLGPAVKPVGPDCFLGWYNPSAHFPEIPGDSMGWAVVPWQRHRTQGREGRTQMTERETVLRFSASNKMPLHSSGLFCVRRRWPGQNCPRRSIQLRLRQFCPVRLAGLKTARFRCNNSFC